LATSLQTPTLIRTFQRKLISQAKVVTRRGILARCHIERPTVVCLAVKSIGKPNAGNRHVGFDERGWETGRLPNGSKLPRHPRLYTLARSGGSTGVRSVDIGGPPRGKA